MKSVRPQLEHRFQPECRVPSERLVRPEMGSPSLRPSGPPESAASVPAGEGRALARVNPFLKLCTLLVVCLSLTLVFDPITPAVFLAWALLAALAVERLPLRSVILPMLPLLFAVVGIFLSNILFNRGNAESEALFYLGSLKVTEVALLTASSISLRILAIAAFSVTFVRTTEASDLILSLVQQARLNHRLAYGLMAGYRMLPLLQEEYRTIRMAQRVRGVGDGGAVFGWAGRLRHTFMPLLAGSVRRAGRVALAMDARAFGAHTERTYRRSLVVRKADWAFLGGSVVLAAGIIACLAVLGVAKFSVGV
jgi:energy-coupling factor transport system permease protein